MYGKVRIVACSDIHGCVCSDDISDFAIRRRANIVVVAGDIQTAYVGRDPRSCFRNEFLWMCKDLYRHGIEVVAIPGNHDSYLRECLGKDNRKRFCGNLHILCDKSETVCGVKFYGTPWVPFINGRWVYEEDDDDIAPKFAKIPKGIDVLISHSPPLGFGDAELWDVSMQNPKDQWEHYGSASLRKVILDKKPRLCICGHIHTGDHSMQKLGDTGIINVSLIDEGYAPAYQCADITIDRDSITFNREDPHD